MWIGAWMRIFEWAIVNRFLIGSWWWLDIKEHGYKNIFHFRFKIYSLKLQHSHLFFDYCITNNFFVITTKIVSFWNLLILCIRMMCVSNFVGTSYSLRTPSEALGPHEERHDELSTMMCISYQRLLSKEKYIDLVTSTQARDNGWWTQ